MSIRILATLVITAIAMILSFFDAFYGLIGYAFWSYLRPEHVTWGMNPIKGLSYAMGAVLVFTAVLQKKKLFILDIKNILAIVFLLFCFAGLFTVNDPSFKLGPWQFQYFTRVILITLLMSVLIDDEKKFRYYCWAIAIFIGLVAAQAGIIGTLQGSVGGADYGLKGPVDDRNFYASILCTIIPIIFYMANTERDLRLRLLLWFILGGSILALIQTYSRGGFVSLLAVAIFLFIRSKRKIAVIMAGFIALYFLYANFLPKEYKERMSTIKKYDIRSQDVDLSAATRVIVWRIAWEIIKDYPIKGVGFYYAEQKTMEYEDPKTGYRFTAPRGVHNTILRTAAELGIPAALVFILIYTLAYTSLAKVRRIVLKNNLNMKYWHYASMLQVAFVGYFVSCIFLDGEFVDIPWHCLGLTVALENIVKKEIVAKGPVIENK